MNSVLSSVPSVSLLFFLEHELFQHWKPPHRRKLSSSCSLLSLTKGWLFWLQIGSLPFLQQVSLVILSQTKRRCRNSRLQVRWLSAWLPLQTVSLFSQQAQGSCLSFLLFSLVSVPS